MSKLRLQGSTSGYAEIQAPAVAGDKVYTLAEGGGIIETSIAGEVKWFAMATAPAGFLKANGATVNRADYPRLFAAIGTTFGAGNGTTTFQLPDLRGEFVRGWDDGRGVDAGRAFGSAQGDEFRSHSHGVTDPGHQHGFDNDVLQKDQGGFQAQGGVGAFPFGVDAVGKNNWDAGTTTNGSNITIQNQGGTETRPRNIALLACIRY